MKNEGTYTTYSGDPLPPVTLESLSAILRTFTDRRPAMLQEVRIHPLWKDVFMANLREEGVRKVRAISPFEGVPVLLDWEVPYGEIKYVYAGDQLS